VKQVIFLDATLVAQLGEGKSKDMFETNTFTIDKTSYVKRPYMEEFLDEMKFFESQGWLKL
jgi:hypothetical protein